MLETEDWEERASGKVRGQDSPWDWVYCKLGQDESPSHRAEGDTDQIHWVHWLSRKI